MPFYVYILKCYKGCGSKRVFSNYYVGQTNNITARMQEHYENVRNGDTDKYTGRFDWVELAWKKSVPSREDALRLESYLKDLNPVDKRNYMAKH